MRITLRPWSAGDLDLLRRLNTPEMTTHLGGPQTDEQVAARHERYLRTWGEEPGGMFTIVLPITGEVVGSVGFWERERAGEIGYEAGWQVLPEHQGRGIAAAAARRVIDLARAESLHKHLHAFPNVTNVASNALCRKLGFTFMGEVDFEYPRGRWMRCNDWRLDLTAG